MAVTRVETTDDGRAAQSQRPRAHPMEALRASIPFGEPGPLTAGEAFLFETHGILVIPDALSAGEVAACAAAADRVHHDLPFLRKMALQQAGPTAPQAPPPSISGTSAPPPTPSGQKVIFTG